MTAEGPPVITAWSAISALGVGKTPFGPRGPAPSPVPDGPLPAAFLAGDFVVEEALGRKGTGSMDRASALAVGVVADLLSGIDVDPGTGVVLGTTSGSTRTQFEFTRDSLTRRKPYFVNPATMPYALMNSAAAQVAIWRKLTGPNTTIAGGRMSGIGVLRYAARLLATGRASGVVCGAVEEYSAERAWLEWHRGATWRLGEGAAALLLERVGSARPALAEVLGVSTRVTVDGDPARALETCMRRLFTRTGVAVGEVAALAMSAPGGEQATAEQLAGRMLFGGTLPAVVLNPVDLVGDVGAVTGPLQVAALLETPGVGLLTGVENDGSVGCALLRVFSEPRAPGRA
ncbi:beta-ketoacyl synthase N-terminal-like domain-containing protein [Saccharomonospora sp. NPDC006951]